MSIWSITKTRTERVVVHLNRQNSREFVCGRVDAAMPERELVAWIAQHARPLDVVHLGHDRALVFLGERGARA